jgi:hypothetical protein
MNYLRAVGVHGKVNEATHDALQDVEAHQMNYLRAVGVHGKVNEATHDALQDVEAHRVEAVDSQQRPF